MAAKGDNAPIIIKRVKKGGHDAHHGGAWKVAYADFVTAMMAFFLLLWLLNATTDEQKRGIADYFSPASPSHSNSGAGGVLGGVTLTSEGALTFNREQVGVTVTLPRADPDTAFGEEADEQNQETPEELSEEELDRRLAEREQQQFEEAERELREAIEGIPELSELANNLLIDQTPEGMRIQIVDEAGLSMFPLGSADMYDQTRRLLSLVAGAIRDLPQQIAIKGHTDATPYRGSDGYSNWELSTDRANASRRALVEEGLTMQRISSVVGLADQDPLTAEDPFDPRNRRISIILLRESREPQ